jgi:acetolactate synthase regulatory subunit
MIAESISKHACKNVTADERSNSVANVLRVIRAPGFAWLKTRNLLTPP